MTTGTAPQGRNEHQQEGLEPPIASSRVLSSPVAAPSRVSGIGRGRFVPIVLTLITAWGVLSTSAVTAFILTNETNRDNRAIIKMGVALIFVWCVLGGVLMFEFRDRFVAGATRIPPRLANPFSGKRPGSHGSASGRERDATQRIRASDGGTSR